MHIPWDDAGCLCPVGDLFNYAPPGDEPELCPNLLPFLENSATDKHVPDEFHIDQSDCLSQRLTDGGFNSTDATYHFYARKNYRKGEQVFKILCLWLHHF